MKVLRNLSIGIKLAAAFGLVLAMTIAVGGVGYASTTRLAAGGEKLSTTSVPALAAIGYMESFARDLRVRMIHISSAKDQKTVASEKQQHAALKLKWNKAVEDFRAVLSHDDERALLEKVLESRKAQEGYEAKMLELAEAGSYAAAKNVLDKESRTQFHDEFILSLDNLAHWVEKDAAENGRAIASTANSAKIAVVSFTLLAALVGLVGGVAISRSILPPVAALSDRLTKLNNVCISGLVEGLKAMEEGVLTKDVIASTTPIENPSFDELGRMCSTFNVMLAKVQSTIGSYQETRKGLSRILTSIQETAESVAATGTQLEGTAVQSGSSAASIASTITQVSASAEESARSTQQIAEGSENLANAAERAAHAVERMDETILSLEASSLGQLEAVTQAIQTAEAGSSAVTRTIHSMERIRGQMETTAGAVEELGRKGEQIGVIVQTIENIAQQTNLLALNAAIEAARAGDQGRGFAVVADEVRKLAEDSTSSAKQIAELISVVQHGVSTAVKAMEASGSEINEGAGLAAEAGASLLAIQTATENVALAAKAGEKSVYLMKGEFRQVSEAISSAAAISEETAAGAEQMSAAAQEVSASAQTVSAAVQQQKTQIEEVADSAERLSQLAFSLKESVDRFEVENMALQLKKAA